MADNSVKRPEGIIEEVLVKVDELVFTADFFILDMKEDSEVPVILGRPFFATTGALIDVRKGKLILRAEDHEVTFDMFESTNSTNTSDLRFSNKTNTAPCGEACDKKGITRKKKLMKEK